MHHFIYNYGFSWWFLYTSNSRLEVNAGGDDEGFRKWHNGGGTFHKSACIDATALIEIGAVVHPKAVISANAQIGSGAIIGPAVTVGQSTKIGYTKLVCWKLSSFFYKVFVSSQG